MNMLHGLRLRSKWIFLASVLLPSLRGIAAFSDIIDKVPPKPPQPPTVEFVECAIVGGGPAGLATAISLTKASSSSSIAIFEKDSFQPKGASIQISKAGWKSLRALDDANNGDRRNTASGTLVASLKNTGVPVTAVGFKPWTYRSEKAVLGKRQVAKKFLSKISKSAASFVFAKLLSTGVHLWHDVRMVLADHADQLYEQSSINANSPPFLNPNCILTSIVPIANDEDDDGFELTFQNSETGEKDRTIRAKYVFACDGTKSAVRCILPNEPDVLLAENKSVWRGMAPNIDAGGVATFYRGTASEDGGTAGRSALIFPGGKDAGSSWTVISDINDGKSSTTEEARERVLEVIESMQADTDQTNADGRDNRPDAVNPEISRLKRLIEDSAIVIENKLHVRDFENQPWESSYDGIIYLGDAAHPVRPTGEGTALAFEDARVLRDIVFRSGLSVDALRAFEQERYLPVKTASEKIRSSAENYYKISSEGKEIGGIPSDFQ